MHQYGQRQTTLGADFATNQTLSLALEVFDEGEHTELVNRENQQDLQSRRELVRRGQQAFSINAEAIVDDLDRLLDLLKQACKHNAQTDDYRSAPGRARAERFKNITDALKLMRTALLEGNRHEAITHAEYLYLHFTSWDDPNADYALNLLDAVKEL